MVLKKYGCKIPEDVAMVGFSNAKIAELIEPALTSVKQPTVQMGKIAARLLLEQLISGALCEPQNIVRWRK